VTVRIPGLARLRADLDRVAADVADTSVPDLEAAELVAIAASQRAPRRTGYLAQSVRPGARQPSGSEVVVAAVYGGVIEGGWPARNIRPQPYLNPAAQAAEATLPAIYENHLDQALRHMELRY
jgi:hypothetical protein